MRLVFFVLCTLVSFNASAQLLAPLFEEGKDYTLLTKPVRTITADRIEVTEAFSYMCGHCYDFEPLIIAWEKTLADDVELVKLPVIWRRDMAHYARIYYTGKQLDIEKQVNKAVFQAIHQQKLRLNNETSVALIFEKLGISNETFLDSFKSFGVSNNVQQADGRTRAMMISGTPQMIIDGKYSVKASREIGHKRMLEIVDFLVDKVRKEKAN